MKSLYIKLQVIVLIATFGTDKLHARPILCGVASGFPPYQFTVDKQPAGLDVDVLKLLSSKIPRGIQVFQAPWIDILGAARFGQIDCIAGIEITSERKQAFDFTRPYYERTAVIIALESNSDIRTIQDLHLKKVGSDLHSPLDDTLKQFHPSLVVRLVKVSEKEQSFHDLKQGNIAALILPQAVARYLSDKYQIPIKFIGEPIHKIQVALAVKKGRTDLLQELQKILESQISEAEFKNILKKYGVN
jgi:polar amino acid transport system substrate-binding protein